MRPGPRIIAGPRCGSISSKEHRPPEAHAQWASSTVLHETYLTFARWTAAIAIAMWALALLFAFVDR